MQYPLVNVITPILNGKEYLKECVESVLGQDYPNIEHIFVDGGSTDGTLEILSKYRSQHPDKIKVVKAEGSNANEAWNTGLKTAKGNIFGWLGADDSYKTDSIETAAKYFINHPETVFVFGNMDILDAQGNITCQYLARDFNLKETLNNACFIYAPATFFTKAVLNSVGYIDPKYQIAGDLDFFIRVGQRFPMQRIDKTLANFRVHSNSVSGGIRRPGKDAYENIIVVKRYGASLFCSRIRVYWLMRLAGPFFPMMRTLYEKSKFLRLLVAIIVGRHKVDMD